MILSKRIIEVHGTADMDVFDVTDELTRLVRDRCIDDGFALVFTPGSTAGVTTIEYESGAVADLKRAMEQLAPRDAGDGCR